MLGQMRHWFITYAPDRERLISYQDEDVHAGTIYKAAGWKVAHIAKPRSRDRSKARVGTRRDYRNNLNGAEPDAAGKRRWEIGLGPSGLEAAEQHAEGVPASPEGGAQ
jgi:hypothetical protein